MTQTVIGMFDTAAQAQSAAQQLAAAGFSLDHVDVASRNDDDNATANRGRYRNTNHTEESTSDSVSDFFSNLFGGDDDDDTARRYAHAARESGSLVTVHAHSAENAHQAAEILDRCGAIDVNERAEQSGYKNQAATANTTNTNAVANTTEGEVSAKVIEENLQVGKRVEQTGGARLHSRIIERPVEASVRLREEHVHVDRKPVDRPATEADFEAFKEGDIEITESAERAVVGKEARVVEEVTLGKEVTEREETVHDTVRKTEVDVENLSDRSANDPRRQS
ncbi:YsnF/AvaK domain-containing protein [Hymenobacter aerilatus]|uniref:YsnF/AvaK domain-containing protein n=1 Tax=Hymenobacter aerilatus TaxID=2932251 RepID=A0A8T9SXA2_9BACT|nr:YsnF/AvaK domain-containing protein [Hymenobacter aerilatus]UOR06475.1 YsnF/AvaK domain-containing protein [Hymenobacter aerilatus]